MSSLQWAVLATLVLESMLCDKPDSWFLRTNFASGSMVSVSKSGLGHTVTASFLVSD